MKSSLSVVKIGGNIIDDEQTLDQFLHLFSSLEGKKILVHGGGNRASRMEAQLGITTRKVDGRRITSPESLEVAVMTYAGLVNKSIVARLQAMNTNAIGLSGADGNAVRAHKRPVTEIDYGMVGDVDGIGIDTVSALLQAGLLPVFCALTHDGQGQLLNTNADTIASEIAIGMSELYDTTLYYCFEKAGVLKDKDDNNSVITHINSKRYEELKESGVISEGMIPKLHNAFHALDNRVGKVCIGNTQMLLAGNQFYTTITL